MARTPKVKWRRSEDGIRWVVHVRPSTDLKLDRYLRARGVNRYSLSEVIEGLVLAALEKKEAI